MFEIRGELKSPHRRKIWRKNCRPRCLLVDDEEEFCKMLSERLENRGMKVNAVLSGEDAVARVEDQNFDAIIVDLAMPGIDGLETLRRIKGKRPD
jgi:CheY-like chemotaxis protein